MDAVVAGASLSGHLSLEGSLGSFHSTDDPDDSATLGAPSSPPPSVRTPPAQIHLLAKNLRIETDAEGASGSPLISAPQRQPPETLAFTNAQAETQTARQGFMFFLAPMEGKPLPTVHAETPTALTLSPAPDGGKEPARQVPTDRPLLHGAPEATILTGGGGLRSLRIEGDFVLMLWEWDLQVSNQSASHLATSGYTYQALAPTVLGTATVGHYEERQVFAYAEDAVLDASMPLGASAALVLRPASGHFDGRMSLQHPDGSLASGGPRQSLHDGDWLEGSFDAAFSQFDAGSYHVVAQGQATAASLDGRLIAFHPAKGGGLWVPWLVGVLMAAAAGGGGAWWFSTRTALRRIKAAMDSGDYAAVVIRSRPHLLRLGRHGDSVRTQRAVALLLLGRPDEAAQTLGGWRRGHDATREYLWACVHASRGDRDRAQAHLAECLRKDPVMGRNLVGDPLLATVSRGEAKHLEGYM
jgi:hypothetical protein